MSVGEPAKQKPSDVIRAMVAMFRTGDTSSAADVVAADYFDHQDHITGPQGFAEIVVGARADFDTLDVDVVDVIEGTDRVAVRLRWIGRTSSGETEQRETIDIVHVANGLAVEHWGGRC